MSVGEKCRQYFENVGSVPRQLEAIGRGRAVSNYFSVQFFIIIVLAQHT
jgi:hypothetical protein